MKDRYKHVIATPHVVCDGRNTHSSMPCAHSWRCSKLSKTISVAPIGWLIKQLCYAKAWMPQLGTALCDHRSKLGVMHGPTNNENLNRTHPVTLAVHHFSLDVWLPYRFLISAEIHNCEDNYIGSIDEKSISVLITQIYMFNIDMCHVLLIMLCLLRQR